LVAAQPEEKNTAVSMAKTDNKYLTKLDIYDIVFLIVLIFMGEVSTRPRRGSLILSLMVSKGSAD